ncbi:DUF397 domain-containing protein [Streptomyces sp. NPDC086787]|uniref:DUF397 domain-containing protein n=1 Tax=Streptomyces sp. NPDC086787 TaxID=3365759 RepID=UPI0038285F76
MSSTLRWFKSSYSGSSGGQCLETAYSWHKSSYSGSSEGRCVEVAPCLDAVVHVRDSKNPEGPLLTVSSTTWTEFLAHAAE